MEFSFNGVKYNVTDADPKIKDLVSTIHTLEVKHKELNNELTIVQAAAQPLSDKLQELLTDDMIVN